MAEQWRHPGQEETRNGGSSTRLWLLSIQMRSSIRHSFAMLTVRLDVCGKMKELAYRFRKTLYSRLFIDTNSDCRRTVLLAGTGRSGTTWVSHILNYRNDHRYIFEPFHPQKVSICGGFRYRQYVRPGNDDETYLAPAEAILTGRLRSGWSDAHNRKLCATKRLVKDIRANLLLKWIHTSFSGIPIILLLRHPCAVANSRLRLNWGTHLDEFLSQEE